jgi:hypothetical protein
MISPPTKPKKRHRALTVPPLVAHRADLIGELPHALVAARKADRVDLQVARRVASDITRAVRAPPVLAVWPGRAVGISDATQSNVVVAGGEEAVGLHELGRVAEEARVDAVVEAWQHSGAVSQALANSGRQQADSPTPFQLLYPSTGFGGPTAARTTRGRTAAKFINRSAATSTILLRPLAAGRVRGGGAAAAAAAARRGRRRRGRARRRAARWPAAAMVPLEAARARPRPGLVCQELWGAGAPL